MPDEMSGEFRAIPQPHHPGRWIVVYARPVRGFENDSVDSVSYPSREAARSAFARTTPTPGASNE